LIRGENDKIGEITTFYEFTTTEFTTLEEAAEFWDKHDLADYWEFTKEVEGDIEFLGLHKPSYSFVS
jgi:hypothetical protein